MNHDNCRVGRVEKPLEGTIPVSASRARLAVSGMGCPNCAARVYNALIHLDGVFQAEVQLENGLAQVLYDQEKVDPRAFLLAVELMGQQSNHAYRASLIS